MTFDNERKFGTVTNVPTMTRPNDPGSPEHAVGVSITPYGHAEPRVQLAAWAAFEQASTTGAVGVTDVGTPARGTAALLTPAQARELAAELTEAADYVEGRPTGGGSFSI